MSTGELTGVQALERAAPGLPLRPGHVARREYEYVRHGTLAFMINFDVANGQVVSPSCVPTRTELDFAAHIRRTVASDPTATKWHVVVDNLDTHRSEALVRYVAEVEGIPAEQLGVKEKRGVLRSMATRSAFLADPSHTSVFHSTPKHGSWLDRSRSGSAFWSASCCGAATSAPSRTCGSRCWPSSCTSTRPWPSPSNGPTRRNHSVPDLTIYRPICAGRY